MVGAAPPKKMILLLALPRITQLGAESAGWKVGIVHVDVESIRVVDDLLDQGAIDPRAIILDEFTKRQVAGSIEYPPSHRPCTMLQKA